jgi:hypothetical protein
MQATEARTRAGIKRKGKERGSKGKARKGDQKARHGKEIEPNHARIELKSQASVWASKGVT